MAVADHIRVGEVGFAAWQSSSGGEAAFTDPAVIEAVRQSFVSYPADAKGDVAVAVLDERLVG